MASDNPTDDEEESTDLTAVTAAAISSDYKVRGKKSASGGTGVLGHNTATSGTSYGVEGVTDAESTGAAGVRGYASGSSDQTYGVHAETETTNQKGAGLKAEARSGSSNAIVARARGGGHGIDTSTDADGNYAVWARQVGASGTQFDHGIVGETYTEVNGVAGVRGEANGTGGNETYGVYGASASSDGYGVYSSGDSKTDGDHHVTGTVSRSAVTTVFLSSAQSIPDSTSTRIAFDSTNDGVGPDTAGDDFGAFDTSDHEYVVPHDGDYRVDVNVDWDDSMPSETQYSITLIYDGWNEAAWGREVPPNSGYTYVLNQGSTVLKNLTKGKKFYIAAKQDSGSAKDISGGRLETSLSVTHVG